MFLIRKVLPFRRKPRVSWPRQMFRKLSFLQIVHYHMKTVFSTNQPLSEIVQRIENEKTDEEIKQSNVKKYEEIKQKIEEEKSRGEHGEEEEKKELWEMKEEEAPIPVRQIYKKEHQVAATRIQQNYRIYRGMNKLKKKIKNQNYRKHIILEIIKTEELFVADLKLIIDQMLTPLKEFLTDQDISILFSNIKQIHALNSQFLEEIKQNSESTLIAHIMLQYIAFFKIYFEYYSNFSKQINHFQHLQITNQRFSDFASNIPRKQEFRYLQYQDFVVKPVQRLPKYVLLLKDLLKHTEVTHPDYQNIKKCYEQFAKVNEDNNKLLNKLQVNQVLFDLQKMYGDKVQVIDPRRSYINQYDINIIKSNDLMPVIVYLMSDLLLVANKKTKKLMNFFYLSEANIKEVPDTENFQNVFSLTARNESITFIDESKERKQEKITLLKDLMKSKEQQIEVTVLGTEERSGLIKTTVVYIIEVRNGLLVQKCYLSFKECYKIQEKMQKEVPDLSLLKRVSFESGHDAKVIDARKIQIENFITFLLNNNPSSSVLEQLGLTSAIFDERARNSFRGRGALGRRSLKSHDSDDVVKLSLSSHKTITITVNDTKMEVGINTKVLDLYPLIEKKYAIVSTWDFKLLAVDNNALRALEDDELVRKLEKNFLFRKFYFLSEEQELSEYMADKNKVILVYNQLIHQLKKGELSFKFEDLCVICAVHLKELTFDNVSKMIPSNLLKLGKKDQWMQQVANCQEKLKENMRDEFIKRLFMISLMKQQNDSIGRQVYTIWDEKRQETELWINYEGGLLGGTEEFNEVQVQCGYIMINEKKYWTIQGYQIKSVLEEYLALAKNVQVSEEDDDLKKQLRELLEKFNYESFEKRRRRR